MRVALLSDIHANVEALDACRTHARARGTERFALLGDFVGYGADPAGVLDVVMRLASEGAIVVKGNHDEAIERRGGFYDDQAVAALDWARRTLTDEQKRFLAALPLRVDEAPMCLVHASAAMPERWTYIDSSGTALDCARAADQSYTFCGHVHDQALYFETIAGRMSYFRPVPGVPIPVRGLRRWVAIVGSAGQPRDRNPAAAYTLFDSDRREITFFRLPYDHHAAAAKIRRAGLPEALAYRIEAGF